MCKQKEEENVLRLLRDILKLNEGKALLGDGAEIVI